MKLAEVGAWVITIACLIFLGLVVVKNFFGLLYLR